MRVLRFDLERPELEYYFHELYQAFDPGVKNVLTGKADGVLVEKTEGTQVVLTLTWEGGKALTRTYQFNSSVEPLENSLIRGFFMIFYLSTLKKGCNGEH